MKKFLISMLVGVMLIGMGSGFATMELTSMQVETYTPASNNMQSKMYEYTYMVDTLGEDHFLEIDSSNIKIRVVGDENMPKNRVKIKADFPSDLVEIRSYMHGDDSISIYADPKPSFVWQALQNGISQLKNKIVYIPDFSSLRFEAIVTVHPDMVDYVDYYTYFSFS